MSDAAQGSPERYELPARLAGLRTTAFVVGGVGLAAGAAGLAAASPAQFYKAYLVAFLFWLGVTLGCLGLMMLHHLSGGRWGLIVRRIWEAGVGTLPLMAIAFVPVVLGAKSLYVWTDHAKVEADHVLHHKAAFLNLEFWVVRAVVYFALWIVFGLAITRLSGQQDVGADPGIAGRMRVWAAPGLILLVLSASFASFDWVMSLTPAWYSTIYGLYFVIGTAAAGMAFTILVIRGLSTDEGLGAVYGPNHLHDYGKLLLAFVLVWTYFGVSQFLIIWSGNLPEETVWYHPRMLGGWQAWSILLVAGHFAIPFALLLSRDRKRSVARLAPVAALVFLMRWWDLYWLVAPTFSESIALHWLDLALPVGLGGIWLGFFLGGLKGRALLPVGEPALKEALAHG